MPMLHVDMSYSTLGQLDSIQHCTIWICLRCKVFLSNPDCYSDRELQLLTFYSFSLVFNRQWFHKLGVLMLQVYSKFCPSPFSVTPESLKNSSKWSMTLSFVASIHFHPKACWFTDLRHFTMIFSHSILRVYRYLFSFFCFKGSNRTIRCVRASRTKGRESEYLCVFSVLLLKFKKKF